MHKWFAVAAAAVSAAGAALLPASAALSAPNAHDALTLAVYGDAPYGTSPADNAQLLATPAFIDSVNADPQVSGVLQVGDIHSGKQYCTQPYDATIASLWTRFRDPLVYTPGDNEWADCHKPGEGGGTYNATTGQIEHVTDPTTGQAVDYAGGDPAANLQLVRSLFFPRPGHTLGGRQLPVLSQAQVPDPAHPGDREFVENVIFERQHTLFVTLNLPGGSNNDSDIWYGAPAMSPAQSREIAGRTGADLRWLDRAFTQARRHRDTSVVILTQADMWDLDGKTPAHLTGYEPIVASIAAHTTAYARPVLMINGDSHVYRSDNPLSPTAGCRTEAPGGTETACPSEASIHPGYDVPNFHRLVVHGSTFPLEWLKLTVTPGCDNPSGPDSFGPFSWQRVIRPA